jgi:hypothetical protein
MIRRSRDPAPLPVLRTAEQAPPDAAGSLELDWRRSTTADQSMVAPDPMIAQQHGLRRWAERYPGIQPGRAALTT